MREGGSDAQKKAVHVTPTLPTELNGDLRMNHFHIQTVLRLSSFITIQLSKMAFHLRGSTDQKNETEYLNTAFVSAQCARYSEESTHLTLNTIYYF